MDSLISRQAAIDALYGITAYHNNIPLFSAVFNIQKLPSAQQWIPVSERLPETPVTVLITDCEHWLNFGFYKHDSGWWYSNGIHGRPFVTAWMPLPEPWKGEQDESS